MREEIDFRFTLTKRSDVKVYRLRVRDYFARLKMGAHSRNDALADDLVLKGAVGQRFSGEAFRELVRAHLENREVFIVFWSGIFLKAKIITLGTDQIQLSVETGNGELFTEGLCWGGSGSTSDTQRHVATAKFLPEDEQPPEEERRKG